MMKLSVVLFMALMASICADDMEDAQKKGMMEMYKRCLKRVEMTMEELQKFSKENKPNPKMDCLNGCILAEQRILKRDGYVDKQTVEEAAKILFTHQKKKQAEAFKKCFHFKKKLTMCEAGRVIGECLNKIPRESENE